MIITKESKRERQSKRERERREGENQLYAAAKSYSWYDVHGLHFLY